MPTLLTLWIRRELAVRRGGMRWTMRKLGGGFAIPAALALFPSGVFYQSSPAASSKSRAGDNAAPATTVAGIVRTVQDVPVPGVAVRVVHVASGRSWVSWTDRDGKFSYPGLRDRRFQMSTEDVARFEAAVGDLLDELGYPRAVPRPRPESLERASRIRNLLAQDSKWIQIVPRPQAENSEPPSRIRDSRAGELVTAGSFEGRS